MKQIFLKILKILMIIGITLLTGLIIAGILFYLGWPWWVNLFVLTGVAGIGLGLFFFRNIWLKRREQRFVQQIIEQDESYLNTLENNEKKGTKEVQNRWKEAMDRLRNSHLKKKGNPLYVLPWYLIIGESGSGKTTSIKNARLSSPFAEMSRTSGISGTRNCDWWFFEQAIIIDTAGRYAIPVDEGRDKEEWQQFMNNLVKFRKKEPLNGLIVTIAADKLLDTSPELIENDGKEIRRRIDELMRGLGAKFPIALLVTKCDLIQGMNRFCQNLPEKALDQAMGFVNQDFSTDVEKFQDQAMFAIGERLRDIRLLLLHKSGSQKADPALLLFPEEFEGLKPGLKAFVKGAFTESVFGETPILRGLFFSSGRQEGSPFSHFLNSLGLISERDVLPGTDNGFFLYDFFSKILPKDRNLYSFTERTIRWKKLTKSIGLCAWITIGIALCGILGYSFSKNQYTLNNVERGFKLNGHMNSDAENMDKYRASILKVEKLNRGWWIPRMGLTKSKEAEQEIKDYYCEEYEDRLLDEFDTKIAEQIKNYSDSEPDDRTVGEYVLHLVRRINLITNRDKIETIFDNKEYDELRELDPEEEAVKALKLPRFASIEGMNVSAKSEAELKRTNLFRLFWQKDMKKLEKQEIKLTKLLREILDRRKSLNWLAGWVDGEKDISGLSLSDFWGRQSAEADEKYVRPAFTIAGKKRIELFLEEIESVLGNEIEESKINYDSWYTKTYIKEWKTFADIFPTGSQRLKTRDDWVSIISSMATDNGPYFSFFDKMSHELKPYSKKSIVPLVKGEPGADWPGLISTLDDIKTKAEKEPEDSKSKDGFMDKAARIVKSRSTTAARAARAKEFLSSKDADKAVNAFRDYKKSLREISNLSRSRQEAFKLTAKVYAENRVTSDSAFYNVQNSVENLKRSMSNIETNQDIFWKLIMAPLNDLWKFNKKETACQLQAMWKDEVLMKVEAIRDRKTKIHRLLDQDGKAMRFISSKELAGPFIKGYKERKGLYVYGEKKDPTGLDKTKIFNTGFFHDFLTKGIQAVRGEYGEPKRADKKRKKSEPPEPPEPPEILKDKKDSYRVVIRGFPTHVNKGGRKVEATFLEMACSGTQILENLQYPVIEEFNWSPGDCDDVIFKIQIKGLHRPLKRIYRGKYGFPKFLKSFGSGKKTFTQRDFPEYREDLRKYNISEITVKYNFKGHRSLIRFYEADLKYKKAMESYKNAMKREERKLEREERNQERKIEQMLSKIPRTPEYIIRKCWTSLN